MQVFLLLPWYDWLALVAFFSVWIGYSWFANRRSTTQPSLLATTNRYRRLWMLQATYRDPRMVDGLITQSLSSSPSFFASATMLIIGGLLASLGTTDKAQEFVREIPFVARTTMLVFELKLIVLLGIFVNAFFRFTWSMRQYTFASLVLGAMPPPEHFLDGTEDREVYAQRAGSLVGLAAETFNEGIRAYYFSFAVMAWIFSPLVFLVATGVVAVVLYHREFNSDVLEILKE